MGMASDRMTMAQFEARASKLVTTNQTVSIRYQIDDEDQTETWHDLATLAAG